MKNIAIITGASSGIGKEFLLNMPKNIEVDEIWAIAREKNFFEGLKEESNLNIRPFSLDLEKETSLMKIKDLLEEEKPNIKLLINAAGFGKFEKSTNISLEDSVGMIKVNDMALTSLCLMAIPYMKKNSNIINIASVAAFQPVPYINVYAASKAYVLSFSRSLGKELSKEGIHVLTVCPFWTKTKFFDRIYVVDNIQIINETDWSLLKSTEENKLSLITCIANKRNQRLCVQATEKRY